MPPSPTLAADRSVAVPRACRAEWAGEAVDLLPERALWWPARGLLFVADLHIGKAATYRALGQPVPGGTTQENLARLDILIARHAPMGIVFLGDFLHAAQARTPQVLAALDAWRARHAGLALTLVRGNHDSRAGDPPWASRWSTSRTASGRSPAATIRRRNPGCSCWPATCIRCAA